MKIMALALIPLLASLVALPGRADTSGARQRLVVLTDISSLKVGVAEPDDGQSLIRLMLYANEFDIEGLIASSTLGHGQTVRPDLVREVVEAYGRARPALLQHDNRYPPAEVLRSGIRAGQRLAGLKVSAHDSVGEGKDTEASDWIITVVDRPDPRPVWVIIWGGSADLAQALWRVRKNRSTGELALFLSRVRVHSIGDQDMTGPWIRSQFPALHNITQRRAYRGIYRGGDRNLVSSEWVVKHIHGHGPLGDLYPDYRGGDIWSGKLGQVRGIKEGDTPSFLALVPNGLADMAHPELGSWGGRFQGKGPHLTDIPDTDIDTQGDPDHRMSTVYRWRPAFQADFAARLDWCVKPREQANHPPMVRISGAGVRQVKPGDVVGLDASGSSDPDGHDLDFQWGIYPLDEAFAGKVTIVRDGKTGCRVTVGDLPDGKTIPMLLTVRDSGSPGLTRYGRALLRVGR